MHTLPIKYPREGVFESVGWFRLALLVFAMLGFLLVYGVWRYPRHVHEEVSQAQVLDWIRQGHVTNLVYEPDASTGFRYLAGVYWQPAAAPDILRTAVDFKVPVDLALDPFLLSKIRDAGYKGTIETGNNTNIVWPLFLNFVPMILLAIIFLLVIRILARLVVRH